MAFTVNTIAYFDPFELRDPSDALITGKVTGDWTKTLYLNGAKVTSPPTITVAEVSGDAGTYAASFTPASVGQYALKLSIVQSGKTYRFSEAFEVVTAAQADPAAALSGVSVTVTSPVIADGGPLKLYQGVDYATADTDSASWALTGVADLTAAQSVTLTIFDGDTTVLSKSGAVTNPGSATQTVKVEFTNAETTALDDTANLRYILKTVLASGRKKTLTRGIVEVVPAEP